MQQNEHFKPKKKKEHLLFFSFDIFSGLKSAQKPLQQTTASPRLAPAIQQPQCHGRCCTLPSKDRPILLDCREEIHIFLSLFLPIPVRTHASPATNISLHRCWWETCVLIKMTLQGQAKFGSASSMCEGHEEHDMCACRGGLVSQPLPPVYFTNCMDSAAFRHVQG